ncbi:MAG: four-carbon acid sugar kinase family protein [Brevibacillus sp.]|nr:four-carbon acid sugar kinase family protein [Brevibacillus sp.]
MEDQQLLLAFYGDDFTGSTDAMEGLASNGYRTILFLEAPTEELVRKFKGIRCIGVAGTSRAKAPLEMEAELRPVFEKLAQLHVPIVHYKVCSTFDSSPEVGSIGKAIEVARDYFSKEAAIPLLVGAPSLGRYTLFGQHFAKMHDEVYRLDRHPTMSRHPITPMEEADLRLHLGKQTQEKIELFNILELDGDPETVLEKLKAKLSQKPGILLFDVLDEPRLLMAGRLIWEEAHRMSRFVVGSSGVEYALTAYWKANEILPMDEQVSRDLVKPADRIFVISGSASPVTKLQIENALQQGFYGIRIPVPHLVNSRAVPQQLLDEAIQQLNQGKSVIMYTAMGPDDTAIAETRERLADMGMRDTESGAFIGSQLGKWTREIMKAAQLRRVVIAGGDTSGFVTRELNVYGLEVRLSISPGAPLCKAYSHDKELDGIELALKGGQLGSTDYFVRVKQAKS